MFQFQKVQLKDPGLYVNNLVKSVSIPKGSIKRWLDYAWPEFEKMFQFQKVQLKDFANYLFPCS